VEKVNPSEEMKKALLVSVVVIPLSFPLGYLLGGTTFALVATASAMVICTLILIVVGHKKPANASAGSREVGVAVIVGVVAGLLAALGLVLADEKEALLPLFLMLGLFALCGSLATYVMRRR
jgi:L-asparagine transporter-like permease